MANILTDQQKKAKAKQIAQAAWLLFQTKGFNQISMAEIAKQAGMSKGTLFNYYRNKEELFMMLLLVGYQDYFNDIYLSLQHKPLTSVGDFREFLSLQNKCLINEHSALIRLNALRGPILEAKADLVDTLIERKHLYQISERLSCLIAQQVPVLKVEMINHIFVVQSAIISGLMNLSGLDRFDKRPTGQTLTDFEIDISQEADLVLAGYLSKILPKGEEKDGTK